MCLFFAFSATPQDNPAGYFNGSPINFAKQMQDTQNLLVIHGTMRLSVWVSFK
jgi:hypothetical protein